MNKTKEKTRFLYVIDFKQERPIRAYPTPKTPIRYLQFTQDFKYLLVGFQDGSYQVREKEEKK